MDDDLDAFCAEIGEFFIFLASKASSFKTASRLHLGAYSSIESCLIILKINVYSQTVR